MLGRVWIPTAACQRNNLAWLRATGRRYIIGAPKSELKKFASELAHGRLAHGARRVEVNYAPSRTRDVDPVSPPIGRAKSRSTTSSVGASKKHSRA